MAAPQFASYIRANIPQRFTRRPQWVNWRYEKRSGDLTKVPYTPGTERRASATDLMTWCSFEEAVAAYETRHYDGVGFVFCSADPFVGIDLDGCRDPETGQIDEWAREIIEGLTDKYVEASPSGRGVHVITRATVRGGRKKGNLEVYGQDHFFTFTGECL
jgi:primase-polymerase (primpol)-like protein